METTCLLPLLTSPVRTRRVVQLRNEMLRRQRVKIDEVMTPIETYHFSLGTQAIFLL